MISSKLSFRKSISAGLAAGITAGVINAILLFIFHAADVISDKIFPQPNQPMTIMPVIMASIIPALIASVVFFFIEKYTNNGLRIFTIISIVLMIISLYSPFAIIPGVTMGYALVLCLMHIVVPLVLLYFLKQAKKPTQHSITYQTI